MDKQAKRSEILLKREAVVFFIPQNARIAHGTQKSSRRRSSNYRFLDPVKNRPLGRLIKALVVRYVRLTYY